MAGRPRKPAAQHQAEGTYRADRHAETLVPAASGEVSIVPSDQVPASVHKEWTMTMRRLVDIGIIIDADIPLLETSFILLADSRYYHELLDRVKESIEELSGEETTEAVKVLVSLGNMYLKTISQYSANISKYGITPSERAKILHALPKKKDPDAKKSIRSVIARKTN